MEKHKISEEQFELICKWKLKISYKKIDERISLLEEEVHNLKQRPYIGQFVKCDDLEYGNGSVVSINSYNLILVKFENKDLNIMCDCKNMTTVNDKVKRKIQLL